MMRSLSIVLLLLVFLRVRAQSSLFVDPFKSLRFVRKNAVIIEHLRHLIGANNNLDQSVVDAINKYLEQYESMPSLLADEETLMERVVANPVAIIRVVIKAMRINRVQNALKEVIGKRDNQTKEESNKESGEDRSDNEEDVVVEDEIDEEKTEERSKKSLSLSSEQSLLSFLDSYLSQLSWPTSNDFMWLVVTLVRVQFFNRLDVYDVIRGKFGELGTDAKLDLADVTTIVENMMTEVKHYSVAIEWYEAALRVEEEKQGEKNETQLEALRAHIQDLRLKHDAEFRSDSAPGLNTQFFHRKFDNNQDLTGRQLVLEEEKLIAETRLSFSELSNGENLGISYGYLCRSGRIEVRDRPTLVLPRCRLETRNDFRLLLRPLKVEWLSEDPPIQLIHDVLNPKQMRHVIALAKNNFKAALVSTINPDEEESDGRVSSVSWLHDSNSSTMASVSQQLELATNLRVARNAFLDSDNVSMDDTIESEPLQVAVYPPGGLYFPHLDTLDDEVLEADSAAYAGNGAYIGNRIATALVYLSDDVVGGRTVFPYLGVAAEPEAGAVLFWHNLLSDGTVDMRTVHGACSTIHGIKMAANKWIREGEQIWSRPCVAESRAANNATATEDNKDDNADDDNKEEDGDKEEEVEHKGNVVVVKTGDKEEVIEIKDGAQIVLG